MNPLRIAGFTRVLGAPKGWDPAAEGPCCGLPILDMTEPGQSPRMVSAWEPTPEEAAKIAAGAPIYLSVVGQGHPPVWLFVGEPPEVV